MISLDHIAVSGNTLADARVYVEEALGVPMQTGGEHDVFFTHNAVLGLEKGLYLEAIAINPDAPKPVRPRWFDLDRFSGAARLTNWICRCDDLDAVLARIPLDMGTPVELRRGALRWRMAVPQCGVLPYDNLAPALIEWQTPEHPATRLAPTAVRLQRLTLCHPSAETLKETLSPLISDDRVAYETGPTGMRAEFATPRGLRELAG